MAPRRSNRSRSRTPPVMAEKEGVVVIPDDVDKKKQEESDDEEPIASMVKRRSKQTPSITTTSTTATATATSSSTRSTTLVGSATRISSRLRARRKRAPETSSSSSSSSSDIDDNDENDEKDADEVTLADLAKIAAQSSKPNHRLNDPDEKDVNDDEETSNQSSSGDDSQKSAAAAPSKNDKGDGGGSTKGEQETKGVLPSKQEIDVVKDNTAPLTNPDKTTAKGVTITNTNNNNTVESKSEPVTGISLSRNGNNETKSGEKDHDCSNDKEDKITISKDNKDETNPISTRHTIQETEAAVAFLFLMGSGSPPSPKPVTTVVPATTTTNESNATISSSSSSPPLSSSSSLPPIIPNATSIPIKQYALVERNDPLPKKTVSDVPTTTTEEKEVAMMEMEVHASEESHTKSSVEKGESSVVAIAAKEDPTPIPAVTAMITAPAFIAADAATTKPPTNATSDSTSSSHLDAKESVVQTKGAEDESPVAVVVEEDKDDVPVSKTPVVATEEGVHVASHDDNEAADKDTNQTEVKDDAPVSKTPVVATGEGAHVASYNDNEAADKDTNQTEVLPMVPSLPNLETPPSSTPMERKPVIIDMQQEDPKEATTTSTVDTTKEEAMVVVNESTEQANSTAATTVSMMEGNEGHVEESIVERETTMVDVHQVVDVVNVANATPNITEIAQVEERHHDDKPKEDTLLPMETSKPSESISQDIDMTTVDSVMTTATVMIPSSQVPDAKDNQKVEAIDVDKTFQNETVVQQTTEEVLPPVSEDLVQMPLSTPKEAAQEKEGNIMDDEIEVGTQKHDEDSDDSFATATNEIQVDEGSGKKADAPLQGTARELTDNIIVNVSSFDTASSLPQHVLSPLAAVSLVETTATSSMSHEDHVGTESQGHAYETAETIDDVTSVSLVQTTATPSISHEDPVRSERQGHANETADTKIDDPAVFPRGDQVVMSVHLKESDKPGPEGDAATVKITEPTEASDVVEIEVVVAKPVASNQKEETRTSANPEKEIAVDDIDSSLAGGDQKQIASEGHHRAKDESTAVPIVATDVVVADAVGEESTVSVNNCGEDITVQIDVHHPIVEVTEDTEAMKSITPSNVSSADTNESHTEASTPPNLQPVSLKTLDNEDENKSLTPEENPTVVIDVDAMKPKLESGPVLLDTDAVSDATKNDNELIGTEGANMVTSNMPSGASPASPSMGLVTSTGNEPVDIEARSIEMEQHKANDMATIAGHEHRKDVCLPTIAQIHIEDSPILETERAEKVTTEANESEKVTVAESSVHTTSATTTPVATGIDQSSGAVANTTSTQALKAILPETKVVLAQKDEVAIRAETISRMVEPSGSIASKTANAEATKLVVQEGDSDGEADDAYFCLTRKRKKPSSYRSKSLMSKLRICLRQNPSQNKSNVESKAESKSPCNYQVAQEDLISSFAIRNELDLDSPDEVSGYNLEKEDSLAFFNETHEDQDPDCIAFVKQRERKRLEMELSRIEQEDAAGKLSVEAMIEEKCKEQNGTFQRKIDKLRSDMLAKQKLQREQLNARHKKQIEHDRDKIQQAARWIKQKQEQEVQSLLLKRQQAQQQGQVISEERWSQISQQLSSHHQSRVKQLRAKESELSGKSEKESKSQTVQLHEHHEKRKKDMEEFMQKLHVRFLSQQQQQRRMRLKQHEDRMKQQRQEILLKLQNHASKEVDKKMEDSVNKRGNDLTSGHDIDGEDTRKSRSSRDTTADRSTAATSGGFGAVARQKRRKTVTTGTPVQLALEIHNEGIVILTRNDSDKQKKNDSTGDQTDRSKSESGRNTEFIPWGVKARDILYSAVCGEVPLGYECDRLDSGGHVTLQGGQIKCMISDLRTSDETAASQRVMSKKELDKNVVSSEIVNLEKKMSELKQGKAEADHRCGRAITSEQECSDALAKAVRAYEKAGQDQLAFKRKAHRYFQADGRTPVATISHADQQKLVNVLSRIKTNFATAENRAKQFKKATTEARKVGSEARIMAERAASAVALVENALKEAKNKSGSNGKHGKNQVEDRVDAVLSVIHLTAEKRRHQPSMKKDSKSPQLWEIPGISESLKESLRHKMQRRRLSIVLRPTRASMLAELGRMLKGESFQKQSISKRHDTELPPDLRAEQLLLLALHPTAPSPALPSVPPYSSSDMWAEPGWQVELDVPDDDPHRGVVLPFSSSAPFLQRQLSECNSVPGRQAASLIRPCQLRTLETPLSTVAQASAPAETHGISSKDIHPGILELDPLHITEDALLHSYNFLFQSEDLKTPNVGRKMVTAASSSKDEVSIPSTKSSAKRSRPDSKTASQTTTKTARTSNVSKLKGSAKMQGNKKKSKPKGSATQQQDASASQFQSTNIAPTAASIPASMNTAGTVSNMYQQQAAPADKQVEQYRRFMSQRDTLQIPQQQAPVQPQSSPPSMTQFQQQPTEQQRLSQLQQMRQQYGSQFAAQQQNPPQAPRQQTQTSQQQQQQQQQQAPQIVSQQQQQQQQQQQYTAQQQQALARMHMLQQQQQQQATRQQPQPPPRGYAPSPPIMQSQATTAVQPGSQQQMQYMPNPRQPQMTAQPIQPQQQMPMYPSASAQMPVSGSNPPMINALTKQQPQQQQQTQQQQGSQSSDMNDPLLMLFDDNTF